LEVKCRQDGWESGPKTVTVVLQCPERSVQLSCDTVSGPKAITAFGPDPHPSCLHLTSNQQQLQNQTPYVVTDAIVVSSWSWA
jgi:hypothetical protein